MGVSGDNHQKSSRLLLTMLQKYDVNGLTLNIQHYIDSGSTDHILKELREDRYNIDGISFQENDVVIDIGGHVGIFSIYLAKRYPFITIYTFEPIPDNYQHLRKNLSINGIQNVHTFNKAVTVDGRKLDMAVHFELNSAGATANMKNLWLPGYTHYVAESLTLDHFFEEQRISHCKLLKIDCEGSEYEILLNAKCLNRVEYLSGEFHLNDYLESQGYSIEKLYEHCKTVIPAERIRFTTWRGPFTASDDST